MQKDPVVIVQALRTPIGAFQGNLSRISAPELGAIAMRGVLSFSGIEREDITEVMMGCVLTAGLGQAPARQATLKAGLGYEVGATTIGKVCGSGMKAVMLAHDQIVVDPEHVIIAGGMESMSQAPHLLKNMRAGIKFGHDTVIDHMLFDGLEDAYDKGTPMGSFADDTAAAYKYTREAQDKFAKTSAERAKQAVKDDKFIHEIIPIILTTPKGEVEINADETIERALPEKLPKLKPAFNENGTVTAGNASSLSDGAAALLLMSESKAREKSLRVRAKIIAHATHAQAPKKFTTAPVEAIKKVLQKANWKLEEVDLFEINEAFAVVPMVCLKELNLDPVKVNIYGGACALGHPIGASGARIMVTLMSALEKENKSKGIAVACIGGGEATAIAIERVE